MARVTEEDAKITRQRILSAAAKVIIKEGWAAATLYIGFYSNNLRRPTHVD
jgi:AcrR family transcriptional regulator